MPPFGSCRTGICAGGGALGVEYVKDSAQCKVQISSNEAEDEPFGACNHITRPSRPWLQPSADVHGFSRPSKTHENTSLHLYLFIFIYLIFADIPHVLSLISDCKSLMQGSSSGPRLEGTWRWNQESTHTCADLFFVCVCVFLINSTLATKTKSLAALLPSGVGGVAYTLVGGTSSGRHVHMSRGTRVCKEGFDVGPCLVHVWTHRASSAPPRICRPVTTQNRYIIAHSQSFTHLWLGNSLVHSWKEPFVSIIIKRFFWTVRFMPRLLCFLHFFRLFFSNVCAFFSFFFLFLFFCLRNRYGKSSFCRIYIFLRQLIFRCQKPKKLQ